jgi:hypothetical protein
MDAKASILGRISIQERAALVGRASVEERASMLERSFAAVHVHQQH